MKTSNHYYNTSIVHFKVHNIELKRIAIVKKHWKHFRIYEKVNTNSHIIKRNVLNELVNIAKKFFLKKRS